MTFNDLLRLIKALRESDKYIEQIYTHGGCYQFFLFIRSIYPNPVLPYMNRDKTHVVTKIGTNYVDITGLINGVFYRMTPEDVALAEKWSFSKHRMLVLKECDSCGEPILI